MKSIKLSAGLKIDIIAKICFKPISESELKLLKVIIDFSTNNSLTITPDLARQIMTNSGLSQSSFNTSLHRLEKKGILKTVFKTKTLHPVFNNILECDKLLISFNPENNPV